MILRSIRAENFGKFSRLEITNLPERGLIGLEGPNESGKSTVGEAIIFAFFGRARASKGCPLENLIRWGEDFLRVDVEFAVEREDGVVEEYSVFREIDRFGTNYVKLLALPGRREIATGNIRVAEALGRLVRLDFFEFQQAFYHDQYGSRRIDPSLRAFAEHLTGVAHMERACDALRGEIERVEREYGHYQKDIGRGDEQRARLGASLERLDGLGGQVEEIDSRVDELEKEHKALRSLSSVQRKLLSSREAVEKRVRDMTKAPPGALRKRVRELIADYEGFARGDAAVGGVAEAVREDALTSLDELRRVDEALRDLEGLDRAWGEARKSAQEDLDASRPGSAAARRAGADAELSRREAAFASASSGQWLLALSFLVAATVAIASALAPERLVALGLPDSVPAPWVAGGAGGVALVALLVLVARWTRARGLRERAREAAESARESSEAEAAARALSERLEELGQAREARALRDWIAKARGVDLAAPRQRLAEFEEAHAELLGLGADPEAEGADEGRRRGNGKRRAEGGGLADLLRGIAEREKQGRKRLQSAGQGAEREAKEIEKTLKSLRSDRDRLTQEIRDCESCREKLTELDAKVGDLEARAAEIHERIEDRYAAIELLESGVATMRAKIGPTLGAFLKAALPRLTNGRYRDVKLDEDLDVRVFAADHSDFLAAVELSGGTNEAITLGLRLALSQAFVTMRGCAGQFVFLDEPFKMMDVRRAEEALEALPALSDDLRQFFVVQPDYSNGQRRRLSGLVQTTPETTELVVAL